MAEQLEDDEDLREVLKVRLAVDNHVEDDDYMGVRMRFLIERGDYQQGGIEDEGDKEGPEADTHAEVAVGVWAIHDLGNLEHIDVEAEGETEGRDDGCVGHADVLARDADSIIWDDSAEVITELFACEDTHGQVEDQTQEDCKHRADDWEGEEFELLEVQDPTEGNQC